MENWKYSYDLSAGRFWDVWQLDHHKKARVTRNRVKVQDLIFSGAWFSKETLRPAIFFKVVIDFNTVVREQ